MKVHSSLRHSLISAGSLLLVVASATAQSTLTWDTAPGTVGAGNGTITGGTGTWNTTNGNWTTDAGANNVAWVNVAGTPKNNAVFGGTAGTVTLGEAISLRNLSFTNTAGPYTITGSTLNFTGGTISTVAQTAGGNANIATIRSNITGSPSIILTPMDGDEVFTLNPVDNGSMVIGAVTGDGGNGSERLSLQGGTGSTGTIASSTGPKVLVTSGSWRLTGASSGRNHEVSAGTLTLNANLNATNRAVILSGTGVLNYNVASAVSASTASATTTDNGFRITGGTLDQTSGSAINTNASTTTIDLVGTLTFAGTNGASSNLHLGSGAVFLKGGNRQISVTNSATTLTLGGVIQNDNGGARGLTKAGAGTLSLSNTSIYTGATSVSAGTLAITGTGSINTTSGISVSAGATFRYNSSTALTVAPALAGNGTSNRAVLGGTGTINTTITLNNLGDVLSPGNSPGIQNFTPNQTWSSFSYDWELNDWTAAVAGTNFDQIGITGTLNLNGGSGSYVLNVLGLTAGNATGSTPNFSETDRSWTILTSSGLTGFDAANWTINTAGFANPDSGTWVLAQFGNNLVLSYTAVPETQVGLFGGIGALMLLRRRRR